jgi:lysozyme family protein
MAWDYESTKAGYENMWLTAEILESAHYDLEMIADVIIKNEGRYRDVEEDTGVPWFWTGAIHSRESSCDFAGCLHNGEEIIGTGEKTTLVPAGRGPFETWEESAIDAYEYQDLTDIHPWDCAQMHLQCELYNGTGYISHETNSPYVWAGTTHQQPGKYVADGVWDPNAWDSQMGCSAIWKKLCERREDIAEAFEVEDPEAAEEMPPEEVSRHYRLVKARLFQELGRRGRWEIPDGVKAAILKNRR